MMLEPKRFSQPLVPPVLPVFCQALNLQRSLLLTCTEEPRAELIHQELKTSACPGRQQARFLISGTVRRAAPDAGECRRGKTEYKTRARANAS